MATLLANMSSALAVEYTGRGARSNLEWSSSDKHISAIILIAAQAFFTYQALSLHSLVSKELSFICFATVAIVPLSLLFVYEDPKLEEWLKTLSTISSLLCEIALVCHSLALIFICSEPIGLLILLPYLIYPLLTLSDSFEFKEMVEWVRKAIGICAVLYALRSPITQVGALFSALYFFIDFFRLIETPHAFFTAEEYFKTVIFSSIVDFENECLNIAHQDPGKAQELLDIAELVQTKEKLDLIADYALLHLVLELPNCAVLYLKRYPNFKDEIVQLSVEIQKLSPEDVAILKRSIPLRSDLPSELKSIRHRLDQLHFFFSTFRNDLDEGTHDDPIRRESLMHPKNMQRLDLLVPNLNRLIHP